jgi:hypothetical protein
MVAALWLSERLELGVGGLGGRRGKRKSNATLRRIVFVVVD